MRRLLPLVGGVVVFAALALATVSSGSSSGARPPLLVFASVRAAGDHGASADEFANLFTLGTDGRGLRRLRKLPEVASDPKWSPDGRQIAFSDGIGSGCHGGTCDVVSASEIWVVSATGKNARAVTREPIPGSTSGKEFTDRFPTWSPDGKKIAFVHQLTFDLSPEDGIYVVGADGRGLHRVGGTLRSDVPPSWSPDGKTLAFVANTRLGLLDVATGEVTYRGPAQRVSWSPVGNTLAFVANSKLGLLDMATGEVTYRGPAGRVSWSPNGRWLAVIRDTGIFVLPARAGAAGRRVVAMTRHPKNRNDLSSCLGVSWSPDSRQLAFSAYGRSADLFIVGADGRGLKRITGNPFADYAPDWRP